MTPPKGSKGAPAAPLPQLASCPKGESELGKSRSPGETIKEVGARFAAMSDRDAPILADVRRIDTERLRIPVFMSHAASEARRLLPERRQRGKGATPEQAEASALMELAERYSYHAFWDRLPSRQDAVRSTWSEAESRLGSALISLDEILASAGESVSPTRGILAKQLFDLLPWTFVPALQLGENRTVWLPAEWFKQINGYNGCAVGNTMTEAVLHGVCEVVERDVCARAVRGRLECPTLTMAGVHDPVLEKLMQHYAREGIQVLLKDFSLDMPLTTVAVLAHDPSSFPGTSEMVFTAGTAASPRVAAIKALTEVAELAGDFCTNSCYTPSGLPKYGNRHESQWLETGRAVPLTQLADPSAHDMLVELEEAVAALGRKGLAVYSLDLTHADLRIPAQWTIAPGLQFLQREHQDGLALYIGRRLAEEAPPDVARQGLDVLGKLMPESTFLQFFQGLFQLRTGQAAEAAEQFGAAAAMQESPEREGLVAYYAAYGHFAQKDWAGALPWLDRAIAVFPASGEAWSLRGICRYKLGDFASAAENFKAALRRNRGSAPDMANLGACYMEMGDYEQARACLISALNQEPDLSPARQRLDALSPDRAPDR